MESRENNKISQFELLMMSLDKKRERDSGGENKKENEKAKKVQMVTT